MAATEEAYPVPTAAPAAAAPAAVPTAMAPVTAAVGTTIGAASSGATPGADAAPADTSRVGLVEQAIAGLQAAVDAHQQLFNTILNEHKALHAMCQRHEEATQRHQATVDELVITVESLQMLIKTVGETYKGDREKYLVDIKNLQPAPPGQRL